MPNMKSPLPIFLLIGTLALSACAQTPTTTSPTALPTLDVTHLGVLNDGTTLNTAALQSAIDALSSHGGGILTFPPGRYLTGTLQLKDNITLHLQKNAILLGSTHAADYQNLDPFTDGNGHPMGYALIVALDAHHVAIEGPGTIDGQGKSLAALQHPYTLRPFLIRWIRCSDISLHDATLQNPGAWTNHFFQCRNISVANLTIRSQSAGLPNNDGIDIDSCDTVHISHCDIQSGDDALCIKATSPLPSQNITLSDCTLATRCNAIKLGTESLGDFLHIHATRCTLHNIGMSGIALYSVDGAHLEDVSVTDSTMDNVTLPISIRLGARLKTFRPGQTPKPVGTLRDITLSNLTITRAQKIGLLINGIPNHPVENLHLDNIQIQLPGGGTLADAALQLPEKEAAYPEWNTFGKTFPAYGAYLRHVRNLTTTNLHFTTLHPDARPETISIDVEK
jgi:polygalacturonase